MRKEKRSVAILSCELKIVLVGRLMLGKNVMYVQRWDDWWIRRIFEL